MQAKFSDQDRMQMVAIETHWRCLPYAVLLTSRVILKSEHHEAFQSSNVVSVL